MSGFPCARSWVGAGRARGGLPSARASPAPPRPQPCARPAPSSRRRPRSPRPAGPSATPLDARILLRHSPGGGAARHTVVSEAGGPGRDTIPRRLGGPAARPWRKPTRGPAPRAPPHAALPAGWDVETLLQRPALVPLLMELLCDHEARKHARVPSTGSRRSWVRPQQILCCGQGSCRTEIPENILREVSSEVWSDGKPGLAKRATPVKVLLRPQARAPRLKQRPLNRHDTKEMDRLVAAYLQYGLLRPCRSPYNTPVFLLREPGTRDYRIVQDLKVINQIVKDVGTAKRNSYTLLNQLPHDLGWFTVLSLKDAFYCIPLSKKSQELFAFEWGAPGSGGDKQYCWTVLPLGFKNAPAIFDEVFAKDLQDLQLEEGVLLQYTGNILIASKTQAFSHKNTVRTLNFLAERGYKVCKKAQFLQKTVKYLGLELSQGQRRLLPKRVLALTGGAGPTTREQLRKFLGEVGFCRAWVPNFGLIVKPLCEALKGDGESFRWTAECFRAFEDIMGWLSKAPALDLPDLRKPFDLFVHERQGVGLGVLTQCLDSTRRIIAYCSKQLDAVARRWPVCLRAVAATHELLQQAKKITEAQPITVYVPHRVMALLYQTERCQLTSARLKKYQGSLLGVRLKTVSALDPATLLPCPGEEPAHDCVQVVRQHSNRADPELQVSTVGLLGSWTPVLHQSFQDLSLGSSS